MTRAVFGAVLVAAAGIVSPAAGQAPDWATQSFEVTPAPARATVGDPVTLRFRVHLHERDLLSDSIPRPTGALPEGVRVVETGPLRKVGDRVLEGSARLAFYRVGHRPVPPFGVPFVRIVSGLRGVLVSDSAFVEIDSVAPAGNPTLKDIKELERQRGPDPRVVIGGLALLALVGAWLRRRRRLKPAAALALESSNGGGESAVVLGPFETALARLTQIEREHWPTRGETERHYEAVADTLRRFLAEAHGIPALERTTAELVWGLPPLLSADGLREQCAALLDEADLVKFARHRATDAEAAKLLEGARDLLHAWRASAGASVARPDDALR